MMAVNMIDRFQKSAGWLISALVCDSRGGSETPISSERVGVFPICWTGKRGSRGGSDVLGAMDKVGFLFVLLLPGWGS